MSRPVVYITRKINDLALQKIQSHAEIDIWDGKDTVPYNILEEKIRVVDGLLTLLTDKIDGALIDKRGANLKVISQMAVGYDNIDLEAATRAGLPIGHTPGVLTETCADFTLALLLAGARRIIEGHNEVQNGVWRPWGPDVLLGEEVNGASLGIIGFGRIGKAVARRAAGFGIKLYYHDPYRDTEYEQAHNVNYLELDDLLQTCDFITIHTSLSEATYHLIDAPQFAMMKSNAILINTSRGGVVNPAALYDALKNRQIRSAALDVFEPEPIPADHPILNLDNLILTPHIASASTRTRQLMAIMAAENLIAGLKNEKLPHCANSAVYH